MGKFGRAISSWVVNFSIAFTALRTNLMRSILTTIGVMIGVFAVILAVAVGEGAKLEIGESISTLGSNMAIVFPQPERQGRRASQERGRLTERDGKGIQKLVPGVTAISPQLRNSVQLVVAGRNTVTSAIGTTPGYSIVSNINAETGRFISDADVQGGARVIVLGPSVATKLFGDIDPVGQALRVNKVPFTVIGILESKGTSFGQDNDDLTIVPISTARQRFSQSNLPGPDDINVLFVGFDESVNLVEGKKDISKVMRERYRVREGKDSPFTIETTEEFAEQSNQITGILQGILVAIASISLLVGGIGIMNIMLVSVTERTREIGLRMALGARRRDIRNQFLVEAAVLCMIGGALGLLLAFGAGRLFENLADFPAPIGISTSVFAIAFSAFIGLTFGGYPAFRASRLSPIEALRSE